MSQSPLRRTALERIEEAGRRRGAPTVTFSGRKISIPGEDIYVPNSLSRWITLTSGFYLPLPPNAFGVVIFPDGTSQNMEGGVHEVPPGLYKLQYVDKHEHLEFTSPISEMTTDGEKLTLKAIFRYRVVDPIVVLRIEKPVETLIEHIESDVAQYIRTHDHTDIADSAENNLDSKLLSFFTQRYNYQFPLFPLSQAFTITGIEIKYFSSDDNHPQQESRTDFASFEKTQKATSFSVFGPPSKKHTYDLFVLMPFKSILKPVYDDHIKKVAKAINLSIARADDIFSNSAIMHDVWSAITQASIVIADCTGRNSNVLYEIGIAHTIGKPVILITQNQNDVPSDLRHIRYILYEYNPSGMIRFENALTTTISEIMKDINANE